MFHRRTTGSIVCPSCGSLVGVRDDRCSSCGRWNPGLWGLAPLLRNLGNDLGFVPIVLWSCSILYAITLIATLGLGAPIGMEGLFSLFSPSLPALFTFGASGPTPVFAYGRWWTILSAGWLHGGLLHIFFNMLWVRQLSPVVADIYGGSRLVIIYTLAGAAGFFLSSVGGAYMPIPLLHGAAGFTVGASASIFGLLGALVYYGKRAGSSLVRREALGSAIPLFAFGLIMPGVDNFAHAGGFIGGYLVARWLDPLKQERLEHLIGALVCLGVSALSVVVSVIHGVSIFS